MQGLVQWQIVDESCGLVFPWFSHPFLDVLKTWDLSGKHILEFGAGLSTLWWRKHAKWVASIEANHMWAIDVENMCKIDYPNGEVIFRQINEGEGHEIEYLSQVPPYEYHVIVNDGIYRTAVCKFAVEYFRTRPGILICDNWMQSFIWEDKEAEEIMSPYQIHKFIQPDHTDHAGKPWNTSYWRF